MQQHHRNDWLLLCYHSKSSSNRTESLFFSPRPLPASLTCLRLFLLQIWSTVVLKLSMTVRWEKIMDIMLVAIPWTFCLAMVVGSSIVSPTRPSLLQASFEFVFDLESPDLIPSRSLYRLLLYTLRTSRSQNSVLTTWMVACEFRVERIGKSSGRELTRRTLLSSPSACS